MPAALQAGVEDSTIEYAKREMAAQKASSKRFRPLTVLKAKNGKAAAGVSLVQRPQRPAGGELHDGLTVRAAVNADCCTHA